MRPTQNWERVTAQTGGSGERLTPGGHMCRIVKAESRQSKAGREMLVIYLDVNEGSQYDGIMERTWKAGKTFGRDKWPNSGTMYQLTTDKDGNTNPRFKGLIQSVEKSNSGYAWNWNEATLRGKMLGVVFGEEEFLGNDGQVHLTIKPRYVCELNKLDEQSVPTIKKLVESDMSESSDQNNSFTEVQDDELPF